MKSVVVPLLMLLGCAAAPSLAGEPIGVITTTAAKVCPDGMVFVSGEYCANINVPCLDWIDPPNAAARRCRLYGESKCAVKTEHREFCMDRTEFTEEEFAAVRAVHPAVARGVKDVDPHSRYPMTGVDYWQAKEICEAKNERMCFESEFLQACSGNEMAPYPGSFKRECDKCNCDVRENIGLPDHRVDHRKTVDEVSACVSGNGVEGLVGNVDEQYTRNVSPGKYNVVEKGGHFLTVRNRCVDASTVAHSELYSNFPTLGWRCCSNPH